MKNGYIMIVVPKFPKLSKTQTSWELCVFGWINSAAN